MTTKTGTPYSTSRLTEQAVRLTAALWLLAVLAVPIAVLVHDGVRMGLGEFWRSLNHPEARHALSLTLWTALLMTLINTLMGILTAYVLARYSFPGKGLLNSLIDLPFAVPTLVAGVMLVTLYGPQAALGSWLKEKWGWQIVFAPSGIVLALLFISLPLVVRAVQPVLMELDTDQEEAARSLGASEWAIFRKILLPSLLPGIVAGALLSFARALGEFGAIVVVAGNIPLRTQTAAVYIQGEIESGRPVGVGAMSVVLIAISFLLVIVAERWQNAGKAKSV